ncbi:MAG TPA: GNAT family N-acetyltransferase [Solirubrobacteraceae bacterium]|jgi:RimJ/RimL family protein N-acetyltransferase|nr:GNAT family N-acetyltransferase [Solirubrobacteraceae bacterium]
MPTIPQPPERFGDELVELREIAEWDIPEVLIAHQDDRDLHRRLGLQKPPTGAQLGSEVEHAEAERLAGNLVKLTIVEPGENDCRGRVEVDGFDWEQGSARVRVWAAPQVRGREYEQHAAELASEWLRTGVGLRDVEVTVLT